MPKVEIDVRLMTESNYKFRPKSKTNRKFRAYSLALAETETMPKEAICQLSVPKSKPNFGRPLYWSDMGLLRDLSHIIGKTFNNHVSIYETYM